MAAPKSKATNVATPRKRTPAAPKKVATEAQSKTTTCKDTKEVIEAIKGFAAMIDDKKNFNLEAFSDGNGKYHVHFSQR